MSKLITENKLFAVSMVVLTLLSVALTVIDLFLFVGAASGTSAMIFLGASVFGMVGALCFVRAYRLQLRLDRINEECNG